VRASAGGLLSLALVLSLGSATAAAEGTAVVPVSSIESTTDGAAVQLEGAALYALETGRYLFSDGSGVIVVDATAAAEQLPLLEIVTVEGTVEAAPAAGGEPLIELSAWAPVRIARPAVIVPEEQVMAAFQGWIVAYGGQAPEPTATPGG
jgi:hypothetical protein